MVEPFEGHVEGCRHLRGGAGEVDLGRIALNAHRDLDRERLLAVPPVVVQEALGPVFAVGNRRDLAAQHALGIVHELLGRREHHVLAVLVQEFDEALDTELGGGDLGFDVAHHLARYPCVGLDELPERAVEFAALIELHALEKHALGEHVRHVDDEARRGRADIHMVCRVGRVAHELVVVEDRRHRGDVRRVARAVIGMVVNHDIAGLPGVVQGFVDPPKVGRDGADMHRRRIRFAKRIEVAVEEPGAEILRLPNDRRVGHAVEHMPHLLRDRVQCTADHLQGDRVDFDRLGGHDSATSLTCRLPDCATVAS